MTRGMAAVVGTLALGGVAWGQFVTLEAAMTADNAFDASVSTSATSQGAVFLSGASWPTTYFGDVQITTAGTHYLHVFAQDWGSPEMFIGEFSLVGSGGWSATFVSPGSASLLTNSADWVVSDISFGVSTVAPAEIGANGSTPWGNYSAISPSARFIWHPGGPQVDLVYFTAVIEVVPAPASAAVVLLLPLAARRRR